MYKGFLLSLICLCVLFGQAQTKKPGQAKGKPPVVLDVPTDSVVLLEEEPPLPNEFKVYTKTSTNKKQRTKLCINLINGDSIFNHCLNDSLLRDPEVQKVLFTQRDADSTYSLIYVAAFTKDPSRPECNAGKESKLFFVRYSNSANKGTVKTKYIESCQKTITRLGREPLENWDGQSPFKVTYNRGPNFIDIIFDPAKYKLGMQSSADAEPK